MLRIQPCLVGLHWPDRLAEVSHSAIQGGQKNQATAGKNNTKTIPMVHKASLIQGLVWLGRACQARLGQVNQ